MAAPLTVTYSAHPETLESPFHGSTRLAYEGLMSDYAAVHGPSEVIVQTTLNSPGSFSVGVTNQGLPVRSMTDYCMR